MFKASQLTDAADFAVHCSQTRTVTLTPDHAFEVSRRDLAATLNQCAVGVKEQLRIVDGAAVTLVHADGHHHARLAGGLADGVSCRGGDRH